MTENHQVSLAHNEMEGSDLGEEKILLDFRHGRYYGLNPSATFIFSLIREPVPLRVIIDAVARRYGIERQRAAADVYAFVETMSKHRLIVVDANGQAG